MSAIRTAVIESVDAQARGVTHLDSKVIFIDRALVGETVEFETIKRKPSYEAGKLTRVVQASAARVQPRCKHFGACGGCSFQHAEVTTQVAAKQRVLEDALRHIGAVQPETIFAPIDGPAWRYRNRARFSARFVPKKGEVLVGFRERQSTYVADMTSCEVLPAHVAALIVPLRALLSGLSIRNRVPQIEVAIGCNVTVLVLRILEPLLPTDESAIRAFAIAHGIQMWLQTSGPESARPFYPLDSPALEYELVDFGIRIGFLPTDFTQVNHAINNALVRRAVQLLAPDPGDRVFDLFCGLGNFSLPLAQSGAHVIGFEGNAGLVQRAAENAQRNGLRAEFAVANLFEAAQVPDFAQADKLIIDPPREGAIEVIKAIGEQRGPRRIVYVSCDPATLARDAGMLVSVKGFRLIGAGIANMFPHTSHVESIALFERGAP